ncbi:MAG TPA: hypothetical protein GX739_04795 [Firmicutes bacterium]|nr:hypothetical protein [Bacillota bacterium]
MVFEWCHESQQLYAGDQLIGELCLDMPAGVTLQDSAVEQVQPGVFKISKTFSSNEQIESFRLVVDFKAHYRTSWAMIPAVSYNGNHWGKGGEPKGFIKDGTPWSFSYSRVSVAGATYSEGANWSVGLFGDINSTDAPFSCSLIPGDTHTVHRLIWPEEEGPCTYFQKNKYQEAFQRMISLEAGSEFRICVYLVVVAVHTEKLSYDHMLDFAWNINYHRQEPWYPPEELWRLGVHYAKHSLYVEESIYRGFSKGLRWNGEEWKLRPTARYLVGWTGQNISLANSMLYSYIRSGNEDDLQIGLNTLTTWAVHARLDNGLIQCLFDHILSGDVQRGLQDACNLSDAAVNFFEAWQLLGQIKVDHDRELYKEVALGICDFAVAHQFPDGNFGKSWSNAGECIDPNGTIGCYLVLPLLQAYRITGDQKYLTSAKRGYDYYVGNFLADGYTSAAALDTYCIDKESAIPLLKSSLQLYELTEDQRYLQLAESASYYLATWQWHYTTPFPAGTPLAEMNYDIFGGTSVSTQHHHIDPYALVFVEDWFRLAEFTGRDIWRQRAKAVWANASMGVSDGQLVINGMQRPIGSQDEGFFHTYWGAPNRNTGNPMGNVSYWLVAWPTAFRLQVLRRLPDWQQLTG